MIARAILFAVLALVATHASTEPVRVRSGEHADFSRLVLIFQSPVAWSVATLENGHTITFDREGLEPDLSSIFDLIPRDRIADVRFEPERRRLFVETACPCPVTVFEAGRGILAIDIGDPDPAAMAAARAQSAAAEPSPPPPANASLDGLRLAVPTPRIAVPLALGPRLSTDRAAAEPLPAEADPAPLSATDTVPMPADTADAPPTEPSGPELPDAFRERLSQEFSRASSAGLIDAARPAQTPDTVAPIDRTGSSEASGLENQPQIRISNALDGTAPTDATGPSAALCKAAKTSLETLKTADDPIKALAEAQAELVDEAGRLSPSAARLLVATYVAVGFGTEALRLLETVEQDIDPTEAQILRTAAEVLDSQPGDRDALTSLGQCGGAAALWALAAADEADRPTIPDQTDMLTAFSELSTPLQLLLGPAVIETLERSDAGEPAAILVRQLDLVRVGVGLGPLRPAAGSNDAAPMVDTVPVGAEMAEARALLIDLRADIEAARAPAIESIELALGYAEELRGSPLGADLLDAAALGHVLGGRAEIAFTLLDRLAESASPEAQKTTFVRLVQRVAADSDDAQFLGTIFGRQLLDRLDRLPTSTVETIAARLERLGFDDHAARTRAAIATPPSPTAQAIRSPEETGTAGGRLANATVAPPEPVDANPSTSTAVAPDPTPAGPAAEAASATPSVELPESERDRLAALREQLRALDPLSTEAGPGSSDQELTPPGAALGADGAGQETASAPAAPVNPLAADRPSDGALDQSASLVRLSQETRAAIEALLSNGTP